MKNGMIKLCDIKINVTQWCGALILVISFLGGVDAKADSVFNTTERLHRMLVAKKSSGPDGLVRERSKIKVSLVKKTELIKILSVMRDNTHSELVEFAKSIKSRKFEYRKNEELWEIGVKGKWTWYTYSVGVFEDGRRASDFHCLALLNDKTYGHILIDCYGISLGTSERFHRQVAQKEGVRYKDLKISFVDNEGEAKALKSLALDLYNQKTQFETKKKYNGEYALNDLLWKIQTEKGVIYGYSLDIKRGRELIGRLHCSVKSNKANLPMSFSPSTCTYFERQ